MKMTVSELPNIIEAILFVTGEPVNVEDLKKALDITQNEIDVAIETLISDYDYRMRGLQLRRFGKHIQLVTRADYAPYVEKLLQPVQKQSLSQAALETLAIIAYKQPLTKAEIESVRGVKCDYSVQSLLNKGLITDVGRKDAPGRPILYATTDAFLGHFGLASLEELPVITNKIEMNETDPIVP